MPSIRIGIAQKLILAFLGLTLLLLVVTLGLARWSFERGFLDYSIALEQTRLQRIARELSERYVNAGHRWDWIDPRSLGAMLRRLESPAPAEPDARPGLGPGNARPRPRPPEPGRLNAPPHRPPPRPLLRPFQHESEPGSGPPTALYDATGRRLAGPALHDPALEEVAELLRVPIQVNDVTVGRLVSRVPPRPFDTPQATAFSEQQARASLWIAAIGVLLAFLVSLLLARALLAPLRQVIAAVAQLAAGDFSTRLQRRRSDELGQLMRGIDQLTETLKANRSARQRWLADISHELRTPVTILAGEIELLRDGLRRFDAEHLFSLDQEVKRLKHLIDDLYALSLSDVGGLRYNFASVDLGDLLREAVDAARQRAEAQGIVLQLEPVREIWVSADSMRLAQLFGNLLENAIAYTDAPGRVQLRVALAADKAVISVEDTPPQPNAAELEQLFEPLYRADGSRSRRRAGAGLGLAICRNIVEGHQGRIRAQPSTLGGLCIQVELPSLSRTSR